MQLKIKRKTLLWQCFFYLKNKMKILFMASQWPIFKR